MSNITGYKTIKTVEGDTFDGLALKFYGEETQASLIISANPDYCATLIFDAGVTIRIPIVEDVQLPETLPPWRRGA
jgi:phage tail protein X